MKLLSCEGPEKKGCGEKQFEIIKADDGKIHIKCLKCGDITLFSEVKDE